MEMMKECYEKIDEKERRVLFLKVLLAGDELSLKVFKDYMGIENVLYE